MRLPALLAVHRRLLCDREAADQLWRCDGPYRRRVLLHRLLVLRVLPAVVVPETVEVLSAWQLFVQDRHEGVEHF